MYVAHSSFWYLRSTRSCHSLFRCCCSALQPLKPAGDHRTHSSADAGASSRSDGEGRPCQCKYRIRKKLELTHGGIMSHSAGRATYGSVHNDNVILHSHDSPNVTDVCNYIIAVMHVED